MSDSVSSRRVSAVASFASRWAAAWDQFWFRACDPATLGVIRICTGCLVFYAHLVWALQWSTFFGEHGLVPDRYRRLLFGDSGDYAWSVFDVANSSPAVWVVHGLGLVIVLLFMLGRWTRTTAMLTAIMTISYANRATGALFGLDQILVFLCLYLAIGNSGGAFSLDSCYQRRSGEAGQGRVVGDVWTNIAMRLIQLHLCVVYLFAGLGKLNGDTWWNGQAIWFSIASYEYQTVDLTWLANHMWLVNLLTLMTIIWEVSYAALIWPRLTRPIVLMLAVLTHLGIGFCMGMMTFGLVMLVANLAFIEPTFIRNCWDQFRIGRAKESKA